MFRNILNRILENKGGEKEAFQRLEDFAWKTDLLVERDSAEYVSGNKLSRSRILWLSILKLLTILHTLRFGLSTVLRNETMRIFLFDYGYLIGNPLLISSAFTAFSLAMAPIGVALMYQDVTKTLYIFEIAYVIKNRLIKYRLNGKNKRKFLIIMNLLGRFFLMPAYYILFIFDIAVHLFFTSVMYLETEEHIYSLIRLIVFNILFIVYSNHNFAIVWLGFVFWVLYTSYLKFKFKEINNKIVLSLKESNIRRLMIAIYEHNYVECLTKDLN